MVKVYAVSSTDRIKESIFNMLLGYLPVEKQDRIRRFYRWEDSQRALLAEILSRYAICKSLNIKNRDIIFYTNHCGKPFLKGYDPFYFNLSHSGRWIVCATDNNVVGIDVEQIKPIDFRIADRFFSPEETEDLMKKDGSERLSYFYDLWTLKESYIKADGRGLSLSLSSFTMKFQDGGIIVKTENDLKDCFFRQYDISSDYKLSVCAVNNEFPGSIIYMEKQQLFKEFLMSANEDKQSF